MSSQPPSTPSRLPGNDGAWFLEAAGIAGTSADAGRDAASSSPAAGEVWSASPQGDTNSEWVFDEPSRTVQRRRSVRWPVVLAAVVGVAIAIALLVWLPGTSERRAHAVAAEYDLAFAAILADMPPGQQALATLTEPTSVVEDFGGTVATITQMQTHADEALRLAGEPLPNPWPLASNQPFVALGPYRDSLSVQATSSEAIARRLGDLHDYRTLADRILAVADLPSDPTAADVEDLRTRLASVSTDSASALAKLPDDAALVAHKAAAREAIERFEEWQIEYLEALRAGDTDGATLLAEELRTIRTELDQLMIGALGRIRSEVDADIIDLAGSLQRTLTQLRS